MKWEHIHFNRFGINRFRKIIQNYNIQWDFLIGWRNFYSNYSIRLRKMYSMSQVKWYMLQQKKNSVIGHLNSLEKCQILQMQYYPINNKKYRPWSFQQNIVFIDLHITQITKKWTHPIRINLMLMTITIITLSFSFYLLQNLLTKPLFWCSSNWWILIIF